jgi:hypothetical protein
MMAVVIFFMGGWVGVVIAALWTAMVIAHGI